MTIITPTKPSTAIPEVDLDTEPMVWLTPCQNYVPMLKPKAQPYAEFMVWNWAIEGDIVVDSGIVTAKVTHTVRYPVCKLRAGDTLQLHLHGDDIKGM